MSANLSPEYKAAEAAFKKAHDPAERLDCLREMLRTIPKHKGTERLQADIKTRIKHLNDDLAGPKKAGARRGPTHAIRPEGAGQIALVGPPNAGKSSLHARLTGSHAEVAPYPFSTSTPLPGMLSHDDIHFQLVDLPPLSRERPLTWIGNALQPADGCMLVVDLQDPDCVESVAQIRELLCEKHVTLLEEGASTALADDEMGDPFAIQLPTLLVATKADLCDDVEGELAVFRELAPAPFPAVAVSCETGQGLERIGRYWFDTLEIVRVYSKTPGHPVDRTHPFTLRAGETVLDMSRLVHRDLAGQIKYARLWGQSGQFDGQQVGRDHPLADGDVVELHI